MKHTPTWLVALPLALTTTAATAQGAPPQTWPNDWHGGYDHMMWSGGYGIFGALMMLLFWGAIIALVVVAVRWFGDTGGGARGRRNDALDILRQRFAKGEIDEDEFRRRKAALED